MTTLPDRNRKRAAVGRTVAILAALLGVLMIGGGVMKLAGQSVQVAAFAALELPAWFRALVGTFEVIGGTLLAIPPSRPVGSLILSTIMVGALWAHTARFVHLARRDGPVVV
jgi:uncharacterized membrane protein YphA (DoxX/SURF4 family)